MKKLLALVFAVLVLTFATVSIVSATNEIASNGTQLWVDGVQMVQGQSLPLSIFAGDTIPIRVGFTAAQNAVDVRIKVEIKGYADDLAVRTNRFDILDGNFYTKAMALQIPYDLKNELSDKVTLKVTVYNDDSESVKEFPVEVQRESYQVDVLSIDTDSKAIAGQPFAVDVVLKNKGMRNLEDLFVTARISALGIERRVYFSDLFALDNNSKNNKEDDSISGRIYLNMPEDAKSGTYALEVSVKNDDVSANAAKQVMVENKFSGESVVASTVTKTFSAGEEVTYDVLVVNPSSTLKIYNIVPETSRDLTVEATQSVVAVPAGSSKNVELRVMAANEGSQKFGVNIYSNNELVKRVELTANVQGSKVSNTITKTSPVIALTIVLAIVFIVLLVVLIALLSRRPQKTEEFGESYY